MSQTFYFYDLETSGFNPREARVMQFGGQRTTLDLEPIGEPQNFFIKLNQDILPDPGAVLLTGITPQKTISEGLSEAEFLKIFHADVVNPNSIFIGYNSIRFDDEFMRYLHYRNFYDPYEWQWRDGRAKWDLLDVARMMRALRPEGVSWPMLDGKPTNQLGLLTKINNISHDSAHDALSDVRALIELSRLIKNAQPKLFEYLLDLMINKTKIAKFINDNYMFVYTSGKYPGEFEKTTVVSRLVDHPKRQAVLVYDLRFDPSSYAEMSVDELAEAWRPVDRDSIRLPVKTLQFNRCPALAPLNVLNQASQDRIKISMAEVKDNYKKLQKVKTEFSKKILIALNKLDEAQEFKQAAKTASVDAMLYDGFFSDKDKSAMATVRTTNPKDLNTLQVKFVDKRLERLFPLYKARNYPASLSAEEMDAWEKHKTDYLLSGKDKSRISTYFNRLEELSNSSNLDKNKRYLVEELKLYGESIIPSQNF